MSADSSSSTSSSLSSSHRFHHTALSYLIAKLKSYGNEISSDHEAALSGFCELASMTLSGNLQKRVRFALPCGMGKTTGVRAILQATDALALPYRIVVASSKVEDLCKLKRTLVDEDGIPESKIGLQHSYPCSKSRANAGQAGYASEPSCNTDAQFLLVTHANVQSGEERKWMDTCDLILFDESLVVGEPHCLPLVRNCAAPSVFSELCTLEGHAKGPEPQLVPAAHAARTLYDQLLQSTQQVRDTNVGVVRADSVDAAAIRAARMALATRPEAFPLVRQLFDWAEKAAELRVFASEVDRTTLITYSITVPNRLQNLIVLDASDRIRELVHHDFRMERAEDVVPGLWRFRSIPGGLSSIKYHSDVRVYLACDAGSRSKMTTTLRDDSAPWMLEKLVRLIASKPTESFLVFTYKSREQGAADFTKRIVRALIEGGIDPEEMVSSGIPNAPDVRRVAVTTWGRETGTNEFSAYGNVVLLGVVRKPEEAVAGAYLGQVEDLHSPQMKSIAKQLVDSECRQAAYQAINRCRVRRVHVIDGVTQALPCSVYVWHSDAQLESKLSVVLPGCPTWQPWREQGETEKTTDVAMRIQAELERAEKEGESRITCRSLRKRLGTTIGQSAFLRARRMALAANGRWRLIKASLHLRDDQQLTFPGFA